MHVAYCVLVCGVAIGVPPTEPAEREARLIVMRGSFNLWSHLHRLEGDLRLSKRQQQQIETVRARVGDALDLAGPEVRSDVESRLGLEAERKISDGVLRPRQLEEIRTAILRDRCEEFGWFGIINSGDVSKRLSDLRCTDGQVAELSSVERELIGNLRGDMEFAIAKMQRRARRVRDVSVRESLEQLTKPQRSQLTAIEDGTDLTTSGRPDETPVLWRHAFRVMSARPDLREQIAAIREFASKVRKDFNEASTSDARLDGNAKLDFRGFDAELTREANRQFLELLDSQDVAALQTQLVGRAIAYQGACLLLDKRLLEEVPQLKKVALTAEQRESLERIKAERMAEGNKFSAEQNKIRHQALLEANDRILGVFDERQQKLLRNVLGAKTLEGTCLVVDLL